MASGKIPRLTEEREAKAFEHNVLTTVAMLEGLLTRWGDPNHELSSDELMYIHFEGDAKVLRRVIDDPQKTAAFRRRRPDVAHLIEEARKVVENLDELHQVREELVALYRKPDGSDIQKELIEDGTIEDRAALRQLSVQAQQALEAQLDTHGYFKLTATQKNTIVEAIRQRLE